MITINFKNGHQLKCDTLPHDPSNYCPDYYFMTKDGDVYFTGEFVYKFTMGLWFILTDSEEKMILDQIGADDVDCLNIFIER